eukprot:gene37664-46464_t
MRVNSDLKYDRLHAIVKCGSSGDDNNFRFNFSGQPIIRSTEFQKVIVLPNSIGSGGFPFLILDGGDGRPVIEVEWRGIKQRLSPEEVSSMVLLEMKRAAESALGRSIKKAVITVP